MKASTVSTVPFEDVNLTKHVSVFRQILLIGGSNPIEDVEKFKTQG